VPDVCAEFAARASAEVRSRFAFDIFAAFSMTNTSANPKKKRKRNSLTPTFCLAQVGTDFPRAHADHAETLCLVKCTYFFLCLAERHTICQFSELRLRVCLLGFASARFRVGVSENSLEAGW
jgi:hypothetical protein